ncbi:hypothetical protein [Candidatus Magnetobacterium casense]|uniref:Uncharacterized protein n=1 Tax=Candidatus Magnetobacterium casense TaxID=1455061 RepID=A0ABS6RUP5_9BACT|nr:hypothetical protein [Candidatus Magnetobacterium casensis]MBV6340350.1 hypothetical protein [Candidatus Magnetobacterium casensis]
MLTKEEQGLNAQLNKLRCYQEEVKQRSEDREIKIQKYEALLKSIVAKRLLSYGLSEYVLNPAEFKVFGRSRMSRVELEKQVRSDVEKKMP